MPVLSSSSHLLMFALMINSLCSRFQYKCNCMNYYCQSSFLPSWLLLLSGSSTWWILYTTYNWLATCKENWVGSVVKLVKQNSPNSEWEYDFMHTPSCEWLRWWLILSWRENATGCCFQLALHICIYLNVLHLLLLVYEPFWICIFVLTLRLVQENI